MTREYIKVGLVLTFRVFQIMVIIPASFIGGIILVSALAGKSPVQDAVIATYQWAEVAVRPAAPGNLLIAECTAPTQKSVASPALPCRNTKIKSVPIAMAAASLASTIKTGYLAFVILGFGVLMTACPGRKFWGLTQQANV